LRKLTEEELELLDAATRFRADRRGTVNTDIATLAHQNRLLRDAGIPIHVFEGKKEQYNLLIGDEYDSLQHWYRRNSPREHFRTFLDPLVFIFFLPFQSHRLLLLLEFVRSLIDYHSQMILSRSISIQLSSATLAFQSTVYGSPVQEHVNQTPSTTTPALSSTAAAPSIAPMHQFKSERFDFFSSTLSSTLVFELLQPTLLRSSTFSNRQQLYRPGSSTRNWESIFANRLSLHSVPNLSYRFRQFGAKRRPSHSRLTQKKLLQL